MIDVNLLLSLIFKVTARLLKQVSSKHVCQILIYPTYTRSSLFIATSEIIC